MDRAEDTLKSVLNAAIGVQAVLVILLASGIWLNIGRSGLSVLSPVLLLAFTLACGFWIFLTTRRHSNLVWMPPVGYLGGSALFFGFGPLVYYLGNEDTLTYLAGRLLPSDPAALAQAQLLSFAAIGLVMIGMRLALSLPMAFLAGISGRRDGVRFSPEAVAIALLTLGFAYKFGIENPGRWGWYSVQLPSAISLLNTFNAVGLGILAFVATRRKGGWLLAFWLIWALDTSFAALEFSKRPIANNLLLPVIGYFAASRNVQRTALLVLVSIGIYSLSTPWVAYARLSTFEADGRSPPVSLVDRLSILGDYATGRLAPGTISDRGDLQIWWTRLDFSSKQAFVIDMRSQGIESPSMSDFFTRLIPRIVWPDKPIIVGAGREFYRMVTGRDVQNFSSVSVYGDIYWHAGIAGLLLFCPMIGIVLIVMMRMLRPAIDNLNYAYFPAVLLGIVFAVSDLNKYVDSVIMRILYFLAYFALMRIILLLAEGTERRSPAPVAGAGNPRY